MGQCECDGRTTTSLGLYCIIAVFQLEIREVGSRDQRSLLHDDTKTTAIFEDEGLLLQARNPTGASKISPIHNSLTTRTIRTLKSSHARLMFD